jgi:hypothetical protein
MSSSDMAEALEEIGATCIEDDPKGEGCITMLCQMMGIKYTRWLQRKMQCICKEPDSPDTKENRKQRKALIQTIVSYKILPGVDRCQAQ